jgi:hypothetical protein
VHLDFWADIGIVCGALLALAAVIAGGARIMRALWRRARREEDLRDMLLGDAERGIPSISQRIESLAEQVGDLRLLLDEHIRWHSTPGGRPAGGPPPVVNGPQRGRGGRG